MGPRRDDTFRLPGDITSIRRDITSILQTTQPDLYTDLLGTQLFDFLNLIDNYDTSDSSHPLTPQVLKPIPACFLAYQEYDFDQEDPDIILLYPGYDRPDEGILYNTTTDLATWASFTSLPQPSPGFPYTQSSKPGSNIGIPVAITTTKPTPPSPSDPGFPPTSTTR
ncbi:MAG: hypothetical protein Q9226_007936 [Calogaya cf. arnoldii]